MSETKELNEVGAAVVQATHDIGGPLADGYQHADLLQIGKNVLSHIDVYVEAGRNATGALSEAKNLSKEDALDVVADLLKAEAKALREAKAAAQPQA